MTSALAVDAGESAEWAVVLDEEADFTAGASAFCEGGEGDDAVETFVVDYEPSGLMGSLNMGSLGSGSRSVCVERPATDRSVAGRRRALSKCTGMLVAPCECVPDGIARVVGGRPAG